MRAYCSSLRLLTCARVTIAHERFTRQRRLFLYTSKTSRVQIIEMHIMLIRALLNRIMTKSNRRAFCFNHLGFDSITPKARYYAQIYLRLKLSQLQPIYNRFKISKLVYRYLNVVMYCTTNRSFCTYFQTQRMVDVLYP